MKNYFENPKNDLTLKIKSAVYPKLIIQEKSCDCTEHSQDCFKPTLLFWRPTKFELAEENFDIIGFYEKVYLEHDEKYCYKNAFICLSDNRDEENTYLMFFESAKKVDLVPVVKINFTI